MKTSHLVLLGGLIAVFGVGCGGNDAATQLSILCGDGQWMDVGQEEVCVYENPITETRFTCPPELPYLYEFEQGVFVCAPAEMAGGDLEDRLEQEGFLPPRDEPPVDEPPVDEPPVDEPPVDEPPVDDPPPVEELCQEGEEQRCTCNGLTPGWQTCEGEGQWGQCECRDDWSAPGVDEVQEPGIDCDNPSLLTQFPADVSNEAQAPGACLTEVFVRGCPITRTETEYEGQEAVWQELSIVNQEAFEGSFEHYMGTQPYTRTWELGESGLPQALEEDLLSDDVLDARSTFEYDDQGRLVHTSLEHVLYEYTSTSSWTYNDQDLLVHYETSFVSEETQRETVTTLTYTEDGKPLETRTVSNGEAASEDVWTYNDAGQPTSRNLETFDGQRTYTEYRYREDGSLLREDIVEYAVGVDENDRNFRWTSDIIKRYFDEEGREVRYTRTNPANMEITTIFEWDYDERGLLIAHRYESPVSGGLQRETAYEYNDQDMITGTVTRNVQRGRDHFTHVSYDEFGQITEKRTLEESTERLLAFERNTWAGEGLQTAHEIDRDGDGDWDSRTTWTYDAAGQLLDLQIDQNADGFIEDRTIHRYNCEN